MGSRAYVAWLVLAAALILSATAALNVAMDPYGMGEGWAGRLRAPGWTQEQDRMPDRGLSGRAAAARRGEAALLLVGTSRTMHGFAPAPGRINLGLTNASFDEQKVIIRAAAEATSPPRLILIEAAALLTVEPGRRRLLEGPTLFERLFSRAATETSLRLLAGPTPYTFTTAPEAEAVRREKSSRGLTTFGAIGVEAYLDAAIEELARICRAGGGRSVIYEPPLGPQLAQAPEVRSAVAARIAGYRRAIERRPAKPCRPRFIDVSGLEGPGAPGAADTANWYDNVHFRPVVGEGVLGVLTGRSSLPTGPVSPGSAATGPDGTSGLGSHPPARGRARSTAR